MLTSPRRAFIFTKPHIFFTLQPNLITFSVSSGAFALLFFVMIVSISFRSCSIPGNVFVSKSAIFVRSGAKIDEFKTQVRTSSPGLLSGCMKVSPSRNRCRRPSQASHSSDTPTASKGTRFSLDFMARSLQSKLLALHDAADTVNAFQLHISCKCS